MKPILPMLTFNPLNEDERRGFNLALSYVEKWGRQIVDQAPSLARYDAGAEVSLTGLIRHGGETLVGCARALARAQEGPVAS